MSKEYFEEMEGIRPEHIKKKKLVETFPSLKEVIVIRGLQTRY